MLAFSLFILLLGGIFTLFGLTGRRLTFIGDLLSRLGGEFAQGIGFVMGILMLILGIWLYPVATVDRSQMEHAKQAAEIPPVQAAAMPVKPGYVFQDCPECPEMVVVPPGGFTMGASNDDTDKTKEELPAHHVEIRYPLSVARYEITTAQWQACVIDGTCRKDIKPTAGNEHPIVGIHWQDTQDYAAFLKKKTGANYRLLSEAEWEFAARAGHSDRYPWGNDIGQNHAACSECSPHSNENGTYPVGRFQPNAYKLFDMSGNVREWVNDCWHDNYQQAPTDGSSWTSSCSEARRVTRGGAWNMSAKDLRLTARGRETWSDSTANLGFRVARVP